MRFYFRTGRGSGISVGPLGLFIIGPLYLLVFLAWLAIQVAVGVLALALQAIVGMRRAAKAAGRTAEPKPVLPPLRQQLPSRASTVKTYAPEETRAPSLGGRGVAARHAKAEETRRRLHLD